MVRIFRHYVSPIKLALAITDFVVITACVFLAEWLRFYVIDFPFELGLQAVVAKVLVPVIMVPVLLGVGGYQSDAVRDLRVFTIRLVVSIVAVSVAVSALLYFLPMLPLWRSILVLALSLSFTFVMLVHALFLKFSNTNFLNRQVIVLGAGKAGVELKEYASKAKEAGLNIIDTIALPGQEVEIPGAKNIEDIGAFDEFARNSDAELIIIASSGKQELPVDALISCKLSGIEVKDRLSFFEQVRGYVDLESVKAEWIIFSDGFKGGNYFERALKRILDIAVSSLVLFLTIPLMIFAAIGVALTSKGPVFYRQERVGLNGETFNLLKFRSMTVDAEKEGRPEWAKEADPRVTKIGGFLRRTRIDELPQLINVFRGDMSFVGPRPERPFFVNQLEKEIPFYKERHCLKPGITGWAQIQYPYGASIEDSKRKLEYDLYYIKNYSIFLDLLIILQTLRVVLFPVGVR
ncbi:TIGR03013 family PEP-CTERM/XrtA system glycosyltransferase [Kordiimonas sp. SCSIO 12603]|uniref:TIGR03013 family XrtA/PEP-CTERM system glycosyltransferase n=1 Tax=Kordiimonas sp. SCSIO 12603 TaxID=2829596 RepID=UPI002106C9AD|nr:TIGR03013 family XrtA/PEP-CTERM system glycosyltransferase [Kordiimonas sp. SCSIO 12603]UTW57591.1 TIGR03013 family PEP-CTERM/XrtA system glycosyltransferase [Kordiimonas sp. SCSIO 12603]